MTDKKLTLNLASPVDNGTDEPVKALTFREPTGEDLSDIGSPIDLDFDPVKVTFNGNMGAMIARLAGQPQVVIKKISAKDWTSAAWMLVPFFLPDPSALSGLAMNSRSGTGNTRKRS